MKKLLVLALTLVASLFGAYGVGDLVTDFNWQDTNLEGSTVTTYSHNLTNMIGTEKKVLFMTYFYPT